MDRIVRKITILLLSIITIICAFFCILFSFSQRTVEAASTNIDIDSNVIITDTFDFKERDIDFNTFNVVGKYIRVSWTETPGYICTFSSLDEYSYRLSVFSELVRRSSDGSEVVSLLLPTSARETANFNYLDFYFPVGTFSNEESSITMPSKLYIDESTIPNTVTIKEIYYSEESKTFYFDANIDLPDTSNYIEEPITSDRNLVNNYLRVYINKLDTSNVLTFKDNSYMLFYSTELVYVDPKLNCRYVLRYNNIRTDTAYNTYFDFYLSSGTYFSNGLSFIVPDELYAFTYNPSYLVKILTPPVIDDGDNSGTVSPDSSVSYTLTLKNTVPFPTFSSERDFVTDENIGGKYLRIYDGADFEFLIDGFSSVSFILFDDRFCLSFEENNFTYNLVMPLLKGDGYCDIYVPSSSDDLVANINNSDFENPIKDEEFSLYIESGTVRVLNPSSSSGGDNSIDNIKLQINSNSKIKLLFSALLGVGLFMSIFFIANKFFSKRKRIARR